MRDLTENDLDVAQPSGEGALIDEVVACHIPALRAFARSLTRDAGDADDLVQDTLVKALVYAEKFTAGTNLLAWLFTIMRNTFLNKVKVSRRECTAAADCASTSEQLSVAPTQEWTVLGREIERAIARLPAHQREMLILVVMLGESYETSARICNCAVGTVKSRVNRARQTLIREIGGS